MSLVALDRTISASQLSTRASLSYKSRRATARGHGGWAVCGCGRRWGAKAWSDAVTGVVGTHNLHVICRTDSLPDRIPRLLDPNGRCPGTRTGRRDLR
jgi:hypothetical protein